MIKDRPMNPKQCLYEYMSKPEYRDWRAKMLMEEVPFHLRFCKSAYKEGGSLHDESNGNR